MRLEPATIIGVIVGVVGLLTALGGVLLGWLKRGPEQEAAISAAASSAVSAISDTLEALRNELHESKEEREKLRAEVKRLRSTVGVLNAEILSLKARLQEHGISLEAHPHTDPSG